MYCMALARMATMEETREVRTYPRGWRSEVVQSRRKRWCDPYEVRYDYEKYLLRQQREFMYLSECWRYLVAVREGIVSDDLFRESERDRIARTGWISWMKAKDPFNAPQGVSTDWM